jgi:AraC-like DNA-binding protein
MTLFPLADTRDDLTPSVTLPVCVVDRAVGVHVLRPGMIMRWYGGGACQAETSAQCAGADGDVCFVFALHESRTRGATNSSADTAGAAGWMTVLPRAELARLNEMTQMAAFYVIVELSREMRREIFSHDNREWGADGFELPGTDGTPLLLSLTPAARLAVESVRRCPLAGACRALILSARCHDLLVEFISAGEAQRAKPVSLMADTKTRVREAAAALSRRLDETPSLEALAREVGLSETTLKRGFRQVFGTTVFEHLRALRMEHARALLQSGEATVIEAATLVGYSNPSNFASAFRRQFGVNPKEFQLAARR